MVTYYQVKEICPDVFLVQDKKITPPKATAPKATKQNLNKKRKRDMFDTNVGAEEPSSSAKKHDYVMVQIKYSTLNLAANGIHLLNSQKQKIYKGHSTLLNEALGYILGKTPEQSYVLGRKSSFKTKGMTYQTDSFLFSLGTIDYRDRDKSYLESYHEALEWVSRLRKDGKSWSEWDPFNEGNASPPPIPELYPNMKNDRDYPWHSMKKSLSKQLGELTECLNLSVQKRNELHRRGIYHWRDVNLDLLKDIKIQQPDLVYSIIQSNKDSKIQNLANIAHETLDEKPIIEFYIDFETVSDLHDNFQYFPKTNGAGMIYMVGCFVKNNVTGKCHYLNYLVDHLILKCEKDMIRDWIKDMQVLFDEAQQQSQANNQQQANNQRSTKKRKRGFPKLHLYHWSQAEVHHLTNALETHGADMLVNHELDFIDLYALFKESTVGIPGAFNYGLKNVAKALRAEGLIATVWPDELDGNQAMVAAWRAEEVALKKGKTMSEIPFMEPIVRYNFVDCKVLEEIVHYLREEKSKRRMAVSQ